MAVPKRKMSRANTRTCRSTWKADLLIEHRQGRRP